MYDKYMHMVIHTFKDTITSQVFRSFGLNLGGFMNVIAGLFLFLIFLNLRGLIPYVFSPTSHLAVSLSLGFPLWLSLLVSGVFFSPSSVVAGLLPIGAPAALNPFLVLIEGVEILGGGAFGIPPSSLHSSSLFLFFSSFTSPSRGLESSFPSF